MTINLADNTPRIEYTVAQGVTESTAKAIPFIFFDGETDIKVYVDNVARTYSDTTANTTQFTVTGGNGSTGSFTTTVTGATGGSTIVVTREIALERTSDFQPTEVFNANPITTLNTQLDRLTAIQADFNDEVTRAIALTDSDTAVSMVLPTKANRLGKLLGFNASTGAVEMFSTLSLSIAGESGTASIDTASGQTLTIASGEGINTSASNQTITIEGEDASTTNKGIANFSSTYFSVSSGSVSLNPAQTGLTEIKNSSIKIARNDDTFLNYGSLGELQLNQGSEGVYLKFNGTSTTSKIDLPNTKQYFKLSGKIPNTNIAVDALTINFSNSGGNAGDATFAKNIRLPNGSVVIGDSFLQSSASTSRTVTLPDQAGTVLLSDSSGNVTVSGNLTVQGTTTTVDSNIVNIGDHNIVLDSDNTTSAVVNGAGITIEGGTGDDAKINYNTSGPKFELLLGSSYEDLQVDKLIASSISLGGTLITADANEFNYLDITTLGTVQASKAVTADSGGDVFFPAGSVLTVGSDGSNPSMVIRGSGPNEVMFAGDSTGTDTDGVSLLYRTNPNDLEIVRASGQGVIAKFNGNTGVAELWHANQGPKLATTSTGVTVGGTLVADGVTLGDNEKAKFGTGDDLEIYHDSSRSYISEQGTGPLRILSSQLEIKNAGDNSLGAKFVASGAVELNHNNELRFRTTSTGIDVLGEDADSGSDNTANIRIIAEGSNEIVTLRSHNGNAQYISRNGTNYGTHLFQGFGTVTPNTINMLQLTSTGHTSYQDLDVQGTLTADDITLHTGSSSLLKFQSPNGSHGYTLRANVNDSVDYGFYLEDIDGTDVLEIRGSAADVNANIATFHRGIVEIKNAGTQSQLRLYCEDSNAHYVSLQAPAHADFSGNQTLTLPAKTGTLISTANSDTPTTTTSSSDADFVLIDDGGTMKKITPSNLGIGGGSGSITVQDEGSALSTEATTLNFVGAGVTASGTGATKTITISGGGGGGSGAFTDQTWGASLDSADATEAKITLVNSRGNVIISANSSASEPSPNFTSTNSVFIGEDAGQQMTSGTANTFIGKEAGINQATTSRKIAIGYQAAYASSTTSNQGERGVYVGCYAGKAASTGTYSMNAIVGDLAAEKCRERNAVVGYLASRGYYYSSGGAYGHSSLGFQAGFNNYMWYANYNTNLGYDAGTTNSQGDDNVFIGRQSGNFNNSSFGIAIGYLARSDANCVAIGNQAMTSVANYSQQCTAIGYRAGYKMGGGDNCEFFGYQAGPQQTTRATGSSLISIGSFSMNKMTTGSSSVGIGRGSLSESASGQFNTAVGHVSGGYQTGNQNTFIGAYAGGVGPTIYSGNTNICIGYNAMPSSTTVSNEITLGDSSISSLRCQVTSITSLSDQRDKTAIEDLDLGLDFIKAMKPRKFVWNRRDGKWHGKKEIGFIAQELHEVEMDFSSTDRTRLVSYEDPSKLEARPMNTYPILVKAIQELSAKVDSLQARITELEGA